MRCRKKILALLLSCMFLMTACGREMDLAVSTDTSTETIEQSAVETTEQSTEETKESAADETEEPSSADETQESSSAEETEESSTEEQTSEPITEAGITFETVEETVYTTAAVNMRMQPAIEDNNVYDVLPAGQPVTRIGYHEEWSMILVGSEKYYVASSFLTTEEPASSEVPEPPAASGSGNGRIVCIDAGHQQHGISEMEPNAPGSTVMKAKLTTGTQGVATGKAEYQLNLEIALLVKQELINRGYQVVMIRETNDCPLSNAERAQVANQSGASIFVRIHANSSTDPAMNGCLTMAPTAANPYVSNLAADSQSLSQSIVNKICERTGFRNIGVLGTDDMTGINWCTIPVTIVEMGYMSNPTEDTNLSDSWYQGEISKGIADGIDQYFASH